MIDALLDGPHVPLPVMALAERESLQESESSLDLGVATSDRLLVQRLLAEGFSCVRENGQVLTKAEFLEQVWLRQSEETRVQPVLEPIQFGDIIVTLNQGVLSDRSSSDLRLVVMHLWFRQGHARLELIHRHESQPGRARGELIPQWGGTNRSGEVGHVPSFEVAAAVSAKEAALAHAMTVNDRTKLRALLHPDLRYIHVTGHRSTINEFPFERSTGFRRVEFVGTTMRQFGSAVVTLVNADFVHLHLPAQSRARAMHCWVNFHGEWRLVARQSTRFLPY